MTTTDRQLSRQATDELRYLGFILDLPASAYLRRMLAGIGEEHSKAHLLEFISEAANWHALKVMSQNYSIISTQLDLHIN